MISIILRCGTIGLTTPCSGSCIDRRIGTWRDVVRGRKSIRKSVEELSGPLASYHLCISGSHRDFWLEFDRYLEIEAGMVPRFFVIPRKDYPGRAADGPVSPLRACRYDLEQLLAPAKEDRFGGRRGGSPWTGCLARCRMKAARSARGYRRPSGSTELGVRMHWLFFDQELSRDPGSGRIYLRFDGWLSGDGRLSSGNRAGLRASRSDKVCWSCRCT